MSRLVLVLLAGCTVKATNGRAYDAFNPSDAIVASARHDIPCDDVQVVSSGGRHGEAMVAEGCGVRLTYVIGSAHDGGGVLILSSRLALGEPKADASR